MSKETEDEIAADLEIIATMLHDWFDLRCATPDNAYGREPSIMETDTVEDLFMDWHRANEEFYAVWDFDYQSPLFKRHLFITGEILKRIACLDPEPSPIFNGCLARKYEVFLIEFEVNGKSRHQASDDALASEYQRIKGRSLADDLATNKVSPQTGRTREEMVASACRKY